MCQQDNNEETERLMADNISYGGMKRAAQVVGMRSAMGEELGGVVGERLEGVGRRNKGCVGVRQQWGAGVVR